jgi:hypothetical protein
VYYFINIKDVLVKKYETAFKVLVLYRKKMDLIFCYHTGANYELVWQQEFENLGSVKASIDEKLAYASNQENWVLKTGKINIS